MTGDKLMGVFKILAVDDDPIIRKILETILESEGYLVMLAAGGSEAVAVLHKENFDLVITDLQMGDLDGFAVLNKAKDLNPLIQRIVITGNQDMSSALKALRIGVEDYILKPFSLSGLLDSVGKCIEKLEIKRQETPKFPETSSLEEQMGTMTPLVPHDTQSEVF
jgi:DNA-binding NtrC family response regulator